jgi:hypothetical protein
LGICLAPAHCDARSCEDIPEAISGPEAVRELRAPELKTTAWHSSENASSSGRKRYRGSPKSIEEVASELIRDGIPAAQARSPEVRTRLAQRLIRLARFWWIDTQIKQLLLRALRNEASASRIARRGVGTPGKLYAADSPDADVCLASMPS